MNNFKKAVAILLAASSVATYAISASASDFENGDVNRDGSVNAFDALLALRYSVSLVDLDKEQFYLADFDQDGVITANDSLMILRYSVGLEGSLEDELAAETVEEPEEYVDPSMVEPETVTPETTAIAYPEITTRTQVAEMKGWAPQDVINKVGPLFTADQQKTGILASVSLAQFIVESGYGQSRLSLEANNCFGIKGYPGQSTWYGSAWDGVSVYNINTNEQNSDGSTYVVYDSFRKYDCMEDSIEDHSAYLRTSMNGSKLRYEGIIGCTDYRTAAQIIKNGGYATAVNYVDVICSVIERWDLTQYDVKEGVSAPSYTPVATTSDDSKTLYRVRSSWDNWQSQLGAFYDINNARALANSNPGYYVFDEEGNIVS